MTAKLHRRTLGAAALAGLALPGSLRAQGSDWPNQPIRLIVPFAAGGPTDIPARLLAEKLSNQLPQRVIVENRTGAGVIVGSEVVAKAPKDGYTLLYNTVAHSVLSALFARLPFDPVVDFAPVALVGVIPLVITVNKDFPATTLAELLAVLRANPNRYDYASSGNGGALHLATELLLKTAGVHANHVPYRGSSAAMPDVMSGRVPIIVDVAASALPYIDRGELRGIAVMSDSRMPQIPNVPTTAEAGMPGLTASTWHMILAPAGTPETVITRINAAVNKTLATPEVEGRLTELAMQVNTTSTPESAKAWLAEETEKWSRIIREADIKVN